VLVSAAGLPAEFRHYDFRTVVTGAAAPVLTLPVSIVIMAALGVLLLAYHLAAAPQAARQPGQAAP
jgi:hypothetical protein